MQIIPAIDLKSGCVVRLTQGLPEHEKVYSKSPETVVKDFQKAGAELIHVVDLDGALNGQRKNLDALNRILSSAEIRIEFGGGLRTIDAVRKLLEMGVARAVIGTKALDSVFMKELIREFKGRIVVGIDMRNGIIKTNGWKSSEKGQELIPFCRQLSDIGADTIIVTDISRDGMLKGPNFAMLDEILNKTSMNVILSGGISSLSDLDQLSKVKSSRFEGVIIGKALYEKRFTLQDAIQKYQTPQMR